VRPRLPAPRPALQHVLLAGAALLLALAGPSTAQTGQGSAAALPRTPRPLDAQLYIISPADGATVHNPVTIRFGLKGMGVAPAGVDVPNTGHHHLLIDVDPPPIDQPIPKDDKHLHFGGGQTEVTLDLPKGHHELQLLLGDKNHIPHDPPLISDRIGITVE
jgi:hypothetical protein